MSWKDKATPASQQIVPWRERASRVEPAQPAPKLPDDPAVASITGLGNRRPAPEMRRSSFVETAPVDPVERERYLEENRGKVPTSPIETDGYVEQVGVKIGQQALGLGAGAARGVIALGDAVSGGERAGDDFVRQTLTEFAITAEGIAGREVEGAPTFEDVKNDPSQALQFIATEGPASLVISPLLLNPYGLGAYAFSQAGSIGQQRAVNDGRDQATVGDFAIAAPFAAGSAALDRFGFERLLSPGAGGLATRIAKAGGAEGLTEGVQGALENLGGSIGTVRGVDGQELLDSVAAGALVGTGAGAGFRGGAEIIDGTGRLVRRRREDARTPAPGNIERAVEAASTPTQADIDSPLDTGDIAEGKAIIAQAEAEKGTARELDLIGMPGIGERVTITDPELGTQTGTMRDRFTGPDGSGVVIELDGGKIMREFDDTLADLGISITAAQQTFTGEADAIDAQLAAAAQNAISSGASSSPATEEAPSSAASDPLLPEAEGGGAPRITGKPGEVAGVLAQAGFSPNVVAGFLGNFEVEGGYGGARGDGGSAAGIAQWRNERRDNFRRLYGKEPDQATPAEQARFVVWEMQNPGKAGMTPAQRDAILAAKSPEEAARLIDQFYERSDGKARERRAQEARKFAGGVADVAPAATAAPAGEAPEEGGRQRTSMLDREGVTIPEGQRREPADDEPPAQRPAARPARAAGEAVQPDMLGGPDRTESDLAAREMLPSVLAQAQEESPDLDLASTVRSLRLAQSQLAADRASGNAPSRPSLADYEGLDDSVPQAIIDAADANPAIIEALAERAGLPPVSAPTETQAAPVEGGDLPAPQATPPAEEAAAPPPANQVQIAPGRTDKSIMLINRVAQRFVEMLRSTVPQAKATPRDKDGNVSYSKKYEAAIRAAIAADAPSAQRGGLSAEMEAGERAKENGRLGTLTLDGELDDGQMLLSYAHRDGARTDILLEIDENGTATVSIDGLGALRAQETGTTAEGANRFGPAAVRDALAQLREMFPQIRRVEGERLTGAGAGRVQSIAVGSNEGAAQEDTAEPQGGEVAAPAKASEGGGADAASNDSAASAGGAVTPIPARTEAESDVAVTATGTEIPVTYAVVEMADLIASNTPDGGVNPAYPADRQPRDRTRAASQAQIAEIASRLNPRLLGRSAKASDGAPIISPDGVVESGNGRTLALQRVYAEGGDSAQAYRQFIEGEGFDIAGMEQPVLVRIRDANLTPEQVQEFVRAANVRDTAGMSGTELAASDAAAMSAQMVDLYRGGDIDAAGNREFVRAFVAELVPTNDRAALILADGSIAKALVARIEAALLVRAFGERPFIEKMVDATDSNIRAIGKALVEMAGKFAKLREAAQDGRVDAAMDITGNIAEAVEIIDRARRENKPITDYVNQRDIFSGATVAQLTEASLRMFFARPNFTKPHGQAKLVSIMDFYVEEAMKAAPGGGLFGESTKATPDGIIGLANERNSQTQPAGADLFAAAPQPGDGADGPRVPEAGGDGGLAGEGVQALAREEGRGSGEPVTAGSEPVIQPVSRETFQNWKRSVNSVGTTLGWTIFDDTDVGGNFVLMNETQRVGPFTSEADARAWASEGGSQAAPTGLDQTDLDMQDAQGRLNELGLTEYSIDRGRGLASNKWALVSPDGQYVAWSDDAPTMDQVIQQGVARARTFEINRTAAREQEQFVKDMGAKALRGEELSDAEIRRLGLRPMSRFDFISPVIQAMLGVSRRDVRKAMGDALRLVPASGLIITDHWWADSRKAIRNAARFLSGQAAPAAQLDRIEDFGEQLTGARKDVWQSYKDRLKDAADMDVAAEPLSKTWPEPDYQKLLDSGADPYVVAWVHAARDEIPTKPQKGWKLKGWVENVKLLRDMAGKLLNDEIGAEALRSRMSGEFSRSLRDLQGRVDLYMEVGHSKSLKGVSFSSNYYSIYRGEQGVTKWVVEKKAKATAFGNWPRELAVGNTREEALAKFKELYASGNLDGARDNVVRFEIYSRRGEPGFIVGKKIGKEHVDLKRFDTVKEARDYRISDAGYAELVQMLERFRDIPPERKQTNSPRIGIDHRSGADVTPEAFAEAFGFRGVQFGNYVEGERRQADLNEAYDALMDLAGVIGVPPRALSLNGELGLAFGARGKGGKGAASAHFEPDTIVINLTKSRGAGSLAHEWWHSLDNYFSRMRGAGGYMTAGGAGSTEGVRPEMVQAFKDVMRAIKSTGLRERSKNLDKRRTKEYWSTDIEMSARAFESYVIAKLQDEQFSNDYLANIVSEETFGIEDAYPYLRAAEIPAVRAAFDGFFATVETRETERGLALAENSDEAYDDGRDPRPALNPDSPAAALRRQLDGAVQPERRPELRALGIAAEIERAGTASLVGREVTAPAQLAEIAQIHRDPRYETFRVFFMRGNEIVHASAVTSRLSNEAPLLPGGRNAESKDVMDWMTSTMESSGADGYYLLHNHPSGDPDPSPADIAVTRDIAAMVPGFRAHVVINSGKFAFITADGGKKVRDLPALAGQPDPLLTPSKPSNILGARVSRYDELAFLAKQAQREGYATVIAADNKFRVRAILDIPNEQLARSEKYLAGMMRRLQRRSGSPHLFLVGDPNVVFADKPRKAFEERIITEIISTDGTPISRGVEPLARESLFSRTSRGMAVTEEGEAYDPAPSGRNMPQRNQAVILAGTDPTWRGKMEKAYNEFRRAAQDRYLPLLRVQRDIELRQRRPLAPEQNPYLGEELMAGRIGARLETLMEDRVRPLFDAMADEKITTEELESFLYARHAPERNARIAEINPEFTEGTGSGMTNLEARAIMARITKQGKMDAMQRLAKRVDEIRDETLDRRVEYGLMSKEEADEWRSTYQFYVPLRGFAEGGGDAADVARVNRSGGGINVRGKESKAAFGRRSVADSPLAYLILQAEEAIVRGETNRVAQRFVELAQANPDENFWQVNKVTSKKRINPDTGLVEDYLDTQLTAADRDWTVTAKINGKERRVTMNRANPEARALADAMRNLTQHQLDFVTKYLGAVNRFLSRINTSYNPEFLVANAVRDVQTAAFNLTAEEQKGLVADTLKNYRAALVASTKGAFGDKSGEWGRWYREFMEDGGRVFFNQTEDVELIKKRIQRIAEQVNAARGAKDVRLQAKRLFGAAVNTIENVNLGVENAIRLAAYKAGRERGMTRENAASLAKGLTVNFNRRGTFGPIVNSLYLFFNASVQGSVRMLQATRSKRLQKVLAGVAVSAAALEIMNAMVSGDDDDGESYYDKIAPYEKRTNLIVMLPNGKDYVKLPLPYGYNVFYGAGRAMAEIARRGGDRWKESAADLLTTALEAFNPIGFDFEGRTGWEALVSLVTPSMLDPIVDLSQNRNFMGKPILPEKNPYGPSEPEHQRYFGGVGTYWVGLSEILNTATGGDDVQEGAISISPGTFEYLFGTVVGAAGSFVDRIASIPTKVGDPTYDFGARDIPFARKVVGGPDPWYDRATYYERVGTIEGVIRDTRDYLDREQFDSARSYAEANAMVLSLEPVMKAAQKEMRDLRKAKRENEGLYEREQIDEATFSENRSLIRDREDEVVTTFNSIWNETVESGREFGAQE